MLKKVIRSRHSVEPQPVSITTLARDVASGRGVAAYKTPAGYPAILIKSGGRYGFRYINNLTDSEKITFESTTIEGSIRKASDAGREVFGDSNLLELLQAVQHAD